MVRGPPLCAGATIEGGGSLGMWWTAGDLPPGTSAPFAPPKGQACGPVAQAASYLATCREPSTFLLSLETCHLLAGCFALLPVSLQLISPGGELA